MPGKTATECTEEKARIERTRYRLHRLAWCGSKFISPRSRLLYVLLSSRYCTMAATEEAAPGAIPENPGSARIQIFKQQGVKQSTSRRLQSPHCVVSRGSAVVRGRIVSVGIFSGFPTRRARRALQPLGEHRRSDITQVQVAQRPNVTGALSLRSWNHGVEQSAATIYKYFT